MDVYLLLGLLIFITAGCAATSNCSADAFSATTFSLIYGTPLLAFSKVALLIVEFIGTNKPSEQRTLASPLETAVVSPNDDTLYGYVVVDLSQYDVAVTAPNVTDGRFWAYSFYDPYGNNFANLGSIPQSKPGAYLIQPANGTTSEASAYEGIIYSPTTYVFLLTRIYVREDTIEDLEVVYGYQDELTVSEVDRTGTSGAPALTASLLDVDSLGVTEAEEILELTARLAPYNGPESYAERERVACILRESGIYDGEYHAQTDVNVTAAAVEAEDIVAEAEVNPENLIELGNDWYGDALDLQGDFGKKYAYRAYIASALFLELVATEAQYPRSSTYGDGFDLPVDRSLLLSFSGLPFLGPSGFWSLTAYDSEHELVANLYGIYEVGSRSNLTYEATTAPGQTPFQVLLQASDVLPPANWTSNWLPTAAGGGILYFALRWYDPEPAMTNGSYVYPTIQEIDAIIA